MKLLSSIFAVLHFAYLFQNCASQSQYKFIIFNDIKGELQSYNAGTETVGPIPCSGGWTCRGGFAKIVQQIDMFRNESDSLETFVLTPGNFVGGESGWLSILGWKRYGGLIKDFYKPTAMSLGMHDFGAGLSRTLDYVNAANTVVVLSNVNCTSVVTGGYEGDFCSHPLIVTKEVHRLSSTIGLVGFVDREVMRLSSPGTLQFTDVLLSLKEIISSSPKYRTYIAMGDGSFELAKQILEQIPEIKLVVYGKSFGSSKDMTGNFPEQWGTGYIATAGNYGSKVGKMAVDIQANGELIVNSERTKLEATDLPVTSYHLLYEFERLAAQVNMVTEVIGSSHFRLVGGKECWRRECNMGNLIAESMVHCALTYPGLSLPSRQPVFALWHGGALFKDFVPADSNITSLDIHKWLPYHNRAYLTRILGSKLLEVFERSATGITADTDGTLKDWGQFLQVSNGMEVHYSTSGDNPRVTQIRLLHDDNDTPMMQPLNPDASYYFVIPSFVLEGRNVYDFEPNVWEYPQSIDFDDTCVANYVKVLQRVAIGYEERIRIDTEAPENLTDSSTTSINSGSNIYSPVNLIVTLVIILIFSKQSRSCVFLTGSEFTAL